MELRTPGVKYGQYPSVHTNTLIIENEKGTVPGGLSWG
jgi:hypothetical protein